MKSTLLLKYTTMLAVTFCVTACAYTNHFLDEEEGAGLYQKISNVKVTEYHTWTYINLETGETETHPDTGELIYAATGNIREAQQAEEIGIDWHIAVHRYDFKTNGARVLNTASKDITTITRLPEGDYTPDEEVPYEAEKAKEKKGEKAYLLSIDMDDMMKGNIGYAHYPTINKVLYDAIIRTETGTMPPIVYSTTSEVFVLKFKDGSWATLQVSGTKNIITGVNHYLSFNYNYYPEEEKE